MKLASAKGGSPFLSRAFAWAADHELTNWAGNLKYGTERLSTATSHEDVQRFVKTNNQFKVLGTRHCFNDIANTDSRFLSLRSQDKVVGLDAQAQTVTIEAGMSYGQLCPHLDRLGFALHNLASLPHISVAGACSTATHGSGIKNGNLATAVTAMEIVAADGSVHQFSKEKNGDKFNGVVVGLGAFGIITKVTLA